jgi:hypothetical protein
MSDTVAMRAVALIGLCIAVVLGIAYFGLGIGDVTRATDAASTLTSAVEQECEATVPDSEVGAGGLIDTTAPHGLGADGSLIVGHAIVTISDVVVTDNVVSVYEELEPEPICVFELPQR